jgi:hypothetical protein
MNTNEIYQKISENIIHQLRTFKKREINPKILNENLILNLSSMCKFLKGKETVNNSTMDVYLPASRFEFAVNNKIRGSNFTVEESKNENLNSRNSLIGDEIKNKQKEETILFNKNSILDFDVTSQFGVNAENFNGEQLDMNQSIMSKSFLNKDHSSMRDNDMSFATDLLDKSYNNNLIFIIMLKI